MSTNIHVHGTSTRSSPVSFHAPLRPSRIIQHSGAAAAAALGAGGKGGKGGGSKDSSLPPSLLAGLEDGCVSKIDQSKQTHVAHKLIQNY